MPDSESLSMLNRQLAHSVKHGRRVTMGVFDGDPVTGYLAGWDEEGYLVLSPYADGFVQRFVRKLGNPDIEFHRNSTYNDEKYYVAMDRIVAPFRNKVLAMIRLNTRPATDRKAG